MPDPVSFAYSLPGNRRAIAHLGALPRLTDLDRADPHCLVCKGEGWVCDSHPALPWGDGDGCCGDCGRPCQCNPLSKYPPHAT